MGWYLAAGGAFTICGATFGWEYFRKHWNARVFMRLFGESGTRIFFSLIGAAVLILGLLIEMRVIQGAE